MNKRFPFILLTFLLLIACGRKKPLNIDGQARINILVADTTGTFPVDPVLGYAPIPNIKVLIQSIEYDYLESKETDKYGLAIFDDLFASEYKVIASRNVGKGAYELNMSATKDVEVYQRRTAVDTLYCSVAKMSGLVINEIYYAGPVNNAYYFYDQFVELYNRTNTTLYLDGIIVSRASQTINPNIEINDYVETLYCFQFPGKPLGKQYPIQPGQFVVIAQDAFDHSKVIANAVDLSNADWEFYDGYGGDWDNFDVPNVNNIRPDKTVDFMINLVHNAVVISDGTEYTVTDNYVRIPLSTILDGVEYSKSASRSKEMTTRVDAGFAGVGLAKYSGQSTQRIEPGYDSNNSTLDFILLDHPTPGRQ
ncbi:MAG TPA: DUF4876 domain-containing protein [Bacteroidetes bacterium]|nr:DUF4876 domain-containing protein [Bacteroidota bacterium]